MFTKSFIEDFFDLNPVSYNLPKFPEYYFSEDEDTFKLDMVVPGFNKDEIEIETKNDILTVKGEFNEKNQSKVRYSKFEKSFKFKDLDNDNLKAKLENGILSLTLKQKDQEKLKKKTIMID